MDISPTASHFQLKNYNTSLGFQLSLPLVACALGWQNFLGERTNVPLAREVRSLRRRFIQQHITELPASPVLLLEILSASRQGLASMKPHRACGLQPEQESTDLGCILSAHTIPRPPSPCAPVILRSLLREAENLHPIEMLICTVGWIIS